MIVRQATAADMASVQTLWQTVFGDDEQEIVSFCRHIAAVDTVFLVCDGERVVSMLTLIEADLVYDRQRCSVGYIYAGATHPSYRGQGLYRQLLDVAEEYAKACGMIGVFLQPADERLARTYERMGFTTLLFAHTAKGQPVHTVEYKLTPEAFRQQRQELLSAAVIPHIDWPFRVYAHTAMWLRFGETADGSLISADAHVCAECVDTTDCLCAHPTGRMKLFGNDLVKQRPIYMGYGMD